MYSVCRAAALLAVLVASAALAPAASLRVCSDPNNMPYSNQQQQGFENQIARLIGKDLNMPVEYFWLRQGGKFFKQTLNRGVCDVVIGVPVGTDQAATTDAYYRSSYAFVTRSDRHLHIRSFDDPQLRRLKIGVQVLGEADDSVPPAHALISRGIVKNLVGFSIFGNLNETDPAADVLRAVEDGKVDVAVVWGPLGGFFARHSRVPLDVTPVLQDRLHPDLPFSYSIAMGVRRGNDALRQTLDRELQRRHSEIQKILRAYGIPQTNMPVETARATED